MRRCDIDNKYKWDLKCIYESDEFWNADFENLSTSLHLLSDFKGTMHNSPEALLNTLNTYCDFSITLEKLYCYANLSFHRDMSNTYYQGLSEKADSISTKFSAVSSFINSEILAMDKETVDNFFNALPELNPYKQFLNNLYREKEHYLSNKIEEILALSHEATSNDSNTYNMLTNADMVFPAVKDDNGDDVTLTHSKFISLMYSSNRAIRENAFKVYYESFENLKNTLSQTYNGSIKSALFYSNIRKYESSLSMSLSSDNIPVKVYENLISTVHKHLPLFHRYMKLRKKCLGVDSLHMYDLYAPMVKSPDITFDYETSKQLCLDGLAPLGEKYTDILKNSFDNNLIDVYPSDNKMSGAYSWGIYANNPFILLNYENKVDDTFTLAHELGHSVHSYLSTNKQHYINYNYTTFLAEIASTVNENLLMQHMLTTTNDNSTKIYLLNYLLEQFRSTLFRQTLFAEFELESHKMVQNGIPLNTESLNELYFNLIKKYYGDNIVHDPQIAFEWSRIPHFYNPFYVFQYATGFSCAIAFSKKILDDSNYVPKYLDFLSSGCSDYSLDILKKAGIDMSSPEPIEDAFVLFEQTLSKLENSINNQNK